MARVIVVGSVNTDLVLHCSELPAPGETILTIGVTTGSGGKGGNQAVAAAAHGASTWLIGAVGPDLRATALRDDLLAAGVDTSHIITVADVESGQAIVARSANGENMIFVVAGSNALLDGAHVRTALDALELSKRDVVLACAEVPEACAEAAATAAARVNATYIYNVAPPRPIGSWLQRDAIIVVNEHEAMRISDARDLNAAIGVFADLSSRVVITQGARGATSIDAGVRREHAAPVVPVVDTTGAGDAFSGALAALLASDVPFEKAIDLAVLAGANAVAAEGARGGLAAAPTFVAPDDLDAN